jgi:hypothetical protein
MKARANVPPTKLPALVNAARGLFLTACTAADTDERTLVAALRMPVVIRDRSDDPTDPDWKEPEFLLSIAALVFGPGTTFPVAGSRSASTGDKFTDPVFGNCFIPGGFSAFNVSGLIPTAA